MFVCKAQDSKLIGPDSQQAKCKRRAGVTDAPFSEALVDARWRRWQAKAFSARVQRSSRGLRQVAPDSSDCAFHARENEVDAKSAEPFNNQWCLPREGVDEIRRMMSEVGDPKRFVFLPWLRARDVSGVISAKYLRYPFRKRSLEP